MAGVFLSYDRDDGHRARQFARALGGAGHQVWWDLHVRGGAQFSKVIDEALKAADVVVVLWSGQSVESAWVRDEAAAGRDSGRLVPVTIDGTEPPLGFRQYQTIDLSRWKGRGRPAALQTLLEDISATATAKKAAEASRPTQRVSSTAAAPVARGRKLLLPAVAAVALLVLLAAALFGLRGSRTISPSVSVEAGDASPLSRDMAQNVLVKLTSLQSISASTVRMPPRVGSVDADIHLAINGTNRGSLIKANVSLVSGRANEMLWSKDFEMPAQGRSRLDDSITFAAARALVCAVEAFSEPAKQLRGGERRLYMNACTALDEAENIAPLISTFRTATQQAPDFAPAWAHLLNAEVIVISDASLDEQSRDSLRADIVKDIRAARRLEADLPEATVAQVRVGPPKAFVHSMDLLDHANAEHPANTAVLTARSGLLMEVGRTSDAVKDAKAAAVLEPFSPALRANYVTTLAYAGGIEKAWPELAEIKQLWPASPPVLAADYAINLRFGHYEKTVRASGQALEAGILGYIKILHDPTDANIDAWVTLAKTHQLNHGQRVFVYQALGPLNRVDQLFEFMNEWPVEQDLQDLTYVLFRPWLEKVRRDPRFMRVAKRTGLVEYWEQSGHWPDFCSDPDLPYNCQREAANVTGAAETHQVR